MERKKTRFNNLHSYANILTNIFNRSKGLIPSLASIEKLCEIYKHPQRAYPTVHVAGTNGKGSVCVKTAAVLQEAGYKVGLYTSPHIACFRERIQINGELISEREIIELFLEIENIPATFFEISTLIAFLYFQRRKVDVAVIETGLGGRWDATNVVTPLVSVITSIGFDHMDILGPTLEDIAKEKAGIMKKGVPVVVGPDVPYDFLKEKADALGCEIAQSSWTSHDFDQENQGITKLALRVLKKYFAISDTMGLLEKPPCRFERIENVIFDVAHNSHGFARLLQMLTYKYPHHSYRFVAGFSKGKDIATCAQLIKEKSHAIHLVSNEHPRLAKLEELQEIFGHNVLVEKSIVEGIENARLQTQENELVIVCGSFFIMAEARKAVGLHDPQDPQILYDICNKKAECVTGML